MSKINTWDDLAEAWFISLLHSLCSSAFEGADIYRAVPVVFHVNSGP